MTFNPYATLFKCPACCDTCNCTKCCSNRGEPYISSAKFGRMPLPGSVEALALAEEARLAQGPAEKRNLAKARERRKAREGGGAGLLHTPKA